MDAKISFVGNLTSDPETRASKSGKNVTNFSVAVNRRWQVDGEWQEEVTFFNCVAWERLGDNLAGSASKGTQIMVEGRIQGADYEKDGNKVKAYRVVCDEIGVSLKFATADVTRNPKDGETSGGKKANKPVVEYDEEPF